MGPQDPRARMILFSTPVSAGPDGHAADVAGDMAVGAKVFAIPAAEAARLPDEPAATGDVASVTGADPVSSRWVSSRCIT
jgi:hypothetical protein